MPHVRLIGLTACRSRTHDARNLIQKLWVVTRHQMRDSGCDRIKQRVKPFAVRAGEIAQHIVRNEITMAGMADTDADTLIVITYMRSDGFQAVMSGMPTAKFGPDFSWLKVEFIVKYDHIGG